MASPLLPSFASLPSSKPVGYKRKRSRSSVEIFGFTSQTISDTKRARIGIQELSTDARPATRVQEAPFPHIPELLSRPASSSGPETRDGNDTASSILDSEEFSETTSSSGDDEESENDSEDESGAERGYDSDSESGSTTTSSSSSSSEDSDSEDDSGMEQDSSRTATIGLPSPEIPRPRTGTAIGTNSLEFAGNRTSSLTARLNSFLPKLAQANSQLDKERETGVLKERNIEDVAEDGRYIEMNLGLGVLEERQDNASYTSDNDGDDDEAGPGTARPVVKTKKHDAMSTLMGRKGGRKPEIQVVDDTG